MTQLSQMVVRVFEHRHPVSPGLRLYRARNHASAADSRRAGAINPSHIEPLCLSRAHFTPATRGTARRNPLSEIDYRLAAGAQSMLISPNLSNEGK